MNSSINPVAIGTVRPYQKDVPKAAEQLKLLSQQYCPSADDTASQTSGLQFDNVTGTNVAAVMSNMLAVMSQFVQDNSPIADLFNKTSLDFANVAERFNNDNRDGHIYPQETPSENFGAVLGSLSDQLGQLYDVQA